jgi:hypothetical protein
MEKKLHNKKFYNLGHSADIIKSVLNKKLKKAWHAEVTVAMRNAHRIGEHELKKSFLCRSLDFTIILKLK